jgi:hypothetical protein
MTMSRSARWPLHLLTVVALSGAALAAMSALRSGARADDDGKLAALDRDDGAPSPRLRWKRPSLQDWAPEHPAKNYHGPDAPPAGWTHLARSQGFLISVYDTPEKPRSTVANLRRGDVVPARPAKTDRTCYDHGATGAWYEIPGGFICSTSGFEIATRLDPLEPPQRRPAVNMPLPFRYARIVKKGAPRWGRRPRASELGACDGLTRGDPTPSGVIECMWDDFFVALDRREEVDGVELFRTVYGEYVRVADTKILETPPLVGERLESEADLPIAFIHGADEVELFCGDTPKPCGTAERYARFRPEGYAALEGGKYVRGPDGALVPAENVRVVRSRGRPPGVQPGESWVHIDLASQFFVAYEGDQPVYTSLISSGKPGHDTPTGLYRVQRKYLSKIMRGHDPKEGIYHVEEVPWTTYYYGSYAVHGAYWHNTFGAVRSHGCTNVAPADARWLYYWGEPELKPQFHAQVKEQALALYFSNDG